MSSCTRGFPKLSAFGSLLSPRTFFCILKLMIRNPGSAYVEFKDLQHAPDQHHVINKEA